MKEIWKKTSLFYKIIAVLLTVVMVGTTMYFHFEKKYVAKAEGNPEAFLAYSDDNGNNWNKVTDGAVGSKTERMFAIFINQKENTIEKIRYKTDGSELTGSEGTEITSFDFSSYTGLEGTLHKIDIEFDDFVSFNWTYSYASTAATLGVPVTITKQDAVNTMTVKHGETPITGNVNVGYYKSGDTLTVEVQTTGTLTGLNILDQSVTDFDPTTNNNIAVVSNNQSGLTTYRYTYTFSGDENVTYTDKVISAVTSISDTNPILDVEFSTLIYDQTKPIITAKVGTEDLNSDKWYTTDSIVFTVTSGGTTDETPILSVTATVGGTAASLTDNNNGTYTLSNVSNGANVIVVTATDAAENTNDSTDGTFTFNVDTESPSISSLAVEGRTDGGFVKLNNSADVGLSGVAFDTTSGVAKLHVTGTKDSTDITAVDIPIATVEIGTCNYSFNLSDVLNPGGAGGALSGHTYDGTYTLNVFPYDAAGNNAVTIYTTNTFTLDTIDPVLNEVILQRHAVGAGADVWQTVTEADLTNGNYLVNKVLFDGLRFKIKAADTNFSTLKINDENGEKQSFTFNEADGEGFYVYTVPFDSINTASMISLTAVVEDKAGNSVSQALTPIKEIDSAIIANLKSIKYNGTSIAADIEAGDDISNYFENKNYKGIYTFSLQATSGYDISNVTLYKGTDIYYSYSGTDVGNSNNDVTGLYTTGELSFVLPIGTENQLLSVMSIKIEDSNGRTKSIALGDLLYDNTQPVVENNGVLNSNTWYQEYPLNYSLVSGKSAVESALENASYTIDGGAATAIEIDGTHSKDGQSINVPESTSLVGTKIVFDAKDKADNTIDTSTNQIYVKVDKTNPTVADIKVNGEAVSGATVIAGTPQLTSTITDNLTVKDYAVTVKYNDKAYAVYPVSVEKDATEEGISHTLQQVLGSKELKDGKYTVSISAKDKSDRGSNVATTTFVVDNTVPVVGASIIDGASGKNNEYYNSNVTVRLTCTDVNFDPLAMSITDNGSAVSVEWKTGNDFYYADYTASAEGLHNVRITGNDKAGLAAEAKQVSFVIDKTVPTVSLLVNGGQAYTESRGTLYLTGPLTLTASITDTNVDAGDLRVQIIKTVPDQATTTSEFVPTSERTFTFSDEADYVVNIFAIDRANNQGPTRTISFRVDTTAPQLTITGANGGTSASAASISFNINEAFWADAKGTVEIYRKAGDGVDETLYKTLTITPTQRSYSLSELLSDTGIYRFEFNAEDRVGHTATASQRITVDRNKPEIILSGVKNYDSTDGAVSISATISDEFYANKTVSATGTRTDATGKKTPVSFSPFASTANPTTINDTFTEEGIYDITIASTDIAGNTSTSSVHFTIDTSDPVIGDLSMFDNKTFNAKTFEDVDLDLDLDELVSDLTVCDVRMYLNGSEYDGISDIEDGSYTLLITAEDELGHTSEKSVTFILDTKEPIFIVTGVEDGEIRNDSYSIEVSLQLDEDTLDTVKLNDSEITVKNNVATLNVTDKGEYELYMKAYDEAGNEAEQTITFTFGEESVATVVTNAVEKAASHWWMWAIVVAAVLAEGGFIFILLKRKKDNE